VPGSATARYIALFISIEIAPACVSLANFGLGLMLVNAKNEATGCGVDVRPLSVAIIRSYAVRRKNYRVPSANQIQLKTRR
jgi:hypothetical protein